MNRIAIAVCAFALLPSVVAQGQTSNLHAGPEYNILDTWAGIWTIQLEAKDSQTGPTYKVEWILKGRRTLGGYFLEVQHVWKAKGIETDGIEVTGYDPIAKAFSTHIFYDDGSSIISAPMFANDETCIENGTEYRLDGKPSKIRVTWNFSPDRKSLSVKREDEKDGTWWMSFQGKGVHSKLK